ncbi:MAG: 1-(5-phosphoribosyl)-5-[(5-phosphoribosylamino)methylideneamino]imidazole-4-carboxamide isomerase, partial [Candidatus Marinimicrobia bacterium]|nr:1-(5-phosphoribosyl)-5-[(5-phosphoribosylamino)methylideneamino]imidazole-4-carboxamide isomerase [Candidatus Neomarinimicrobiota bacterium]
MVFQYFLSTVIRSDGVLKGPNTDYYESILRKLPDLKLIASGGISSLDDIRRLKRSDLFGAIVGKAIYENRIPLDELVKI